MLQTVEVEVTRPDNRDEVDKYELHFNLYKHELLASPELEEIISIIDKLKEHITTNDEGKETFDTEYLQEGIFRIKRLLEITIRMSYGELVETEVAGDKPTKHFIKSEEITKKFETTDVYHVLVDYFLGNLDLALNFVMKITDF